MLGLGYLEIAVVVCIALIVLGPRKLPEVARYLGKFYGMVRRTTYELKHTLDMELLEEDRAARREAAERRREEYRRKRQQKQEPLPEVEPRPQVEAEAEVADEPPAEVDEADEAPAEDAS